MASCAGVLRFAEVVAKKGRSRQGEAPTTVSGIRVIISGLVAMGI
jgi:hypothetical protein